MLNVKTPSIKEIAEKIFVDAVAETIANGTEEDYQAMAKKAVKAAKAFVWEVANESN